MLADPARQPEARQQREPREPRQVEYDRARGNTGNRDDDQARADPPAHVRDTGCDRRHRRERDGVE